MKDRYEVNVYFNLKKKVKRFDTIQMNRKYVKNILIVYMMNLISFFFKTNFECLLRKLKMFKYN